MCCLIRIAYLRGARNDAVNVGHIHSQAEKSGRLDVRKSGVCGAGLNRNME